METTATFNQFNQAKVNAFLETTRIFQSGGDLNEWFKSRGVVGEETMADCRALVERFSVQLQDRSFKSQHKALSLLQENDRFSLDEAQAAIREFIAVPAEQPAEPQHVVVDPLPQFPVEMKKLPNWVRWKLEIVNGRATKVPYQLNGAKASSTDPGTWTTYDAAVSAGPMNANGGIGFTVQGSGFVGIDLDGCRSKETGELTGWAEQIIQCLGEPYTEVTPSGTGIRIWVRGKLAGPDKVFKLNPTCGFGDKVGIEIYDTARYFTVTGDSIYKDTPVEIEKRDLADVYKLFHEIKQQNPPPSSAKSATVEAGEGTRAEWLGTFYCPKFDIFVDGEIESAKPFVISNRIGRLRYESQSEADMAFCSLAAIEFDGDEDKINEAMRKSVLYRAKWDRTDYRNNTIQKAIASAKKLKQPQSVYEVTQTAPVTTSVIAAIAAPLASAMDASAIPLYNPTIECGFVKDVIDAVCNGTTIPRQFMHNALKAYFGTLMSGILKFQNLNCNSSRYCVSLGESGTSKRTVWERGIVQIFGSLFVSKGGSQVKVFESADSGAGLRDAFFDKPQDVPVLVVIDELASLGNKSAETKNPEIVDTMIELADSTTISRVKAAKSIKRPAAKVHDNARLGSYMCAQTGEVVTQAFEGRKKQGIRERLDVEFSPPIEPGDMPEIPLVIKAELLNKAVALMAPSLWREPMSMTPEAKQCLDEYWASLPKDERVKVRLKKNLQLDIYMRAWSRGEPVATVEDVRVNIDHFERDRVIRQVHFRGEISNKVGLYVERLKVQTQIMRDQLNRGLSVGQVATSKRDFQTKTHAFDDNELDFFDRALNVFGKAHLWMVNVKAANGQTYEKFIPMAHENEVWDLSAGVLPFKG